MLPEEKARKRIDEQLREAGWEVVSRSEYTSEYPCAVKEALMQGNKESDYLLFVDNKAIAVLEAKREENQLGKEVKDQVECYAHHPEEWYGEWFPGLVPLVYISNGREIYFRDLHSHNNKYESLKKMDSPKKMLSRIGEKAEFGALPRLKKDGLRDCQYEAELDIERDFKEGKSRHLTVLPTGSGKTYVACMESYRFLKYTSIKKILFLVDRNNLARQAKNAFSAFELTSDGQKMDTLYSIDCLKREEDLKSNIVISTIQKLFKVLTGDTFSENDTEDESDKDDRWELEDGEEVDLSGLDLKLPSDYFQFIIVDECHRSIYGKWHQVLEYFSGSRILGLTATPTAEAYSFFDADKKDVEKYTYEDSVRDGVNVPSLVYRVSTKVTKYGGVIKKGSKIEETSRLTGREKIRDVSASLDYDKKDLDSSVLNENQIRTVLEAYKDSIYKELYPNRKESWAYIPKTLIFAKDENHATRIVKMVKEVFGSEFENGTVPENFVKKITYRAGDSNELIRNFISDKNFRIAVTVTLVSTGTDVKPLEVVLFMNNVHSDVLYTQMKGRGCRVIGTDKLREVTPNADAKNCYYIFDAVGVTEGEKNIREINPNSKESKKELELGKLLERLAYGELSDENLLCLQKYCDRIDRRYRSDAKFSPHLDEFKSICGLSLGEIAARIQLAGLPEYVSSSEPNRKRNDLISPLMLSVNARKKLLELQRGYILEAQDPDEVIYAGFSKETARDFIDNFEKYLNEHKDSIEALKTVYNHNPAGAPITCSMLTDLRSQLSAADPRYQSEEIWRNYYILDGESGNVDKLDEDTKEADLTNLLQIVRYSYGKTKGESCKLVSLRKGYEQRFNLYCGQKQRQLDDGQKEIMRKIADYVVDDGALSLSDLRNMNGDLWKEGIGSLGLSFSREIDTMSRFLLAI